MAADDPQNLGPWERDRVLGTGGFGIVTLWKNNSTQERVAIKKCRWGVDSIMTANHKERWAREVVIMQRLSHQNVVQAVPVPSELDALMSELPLLCMEFCSGGDLRQILNRPENCCGLREPEVRCLLTDMTAAIQYLHSQRITHRDLKPENIVLQERSNCPMIYKLIDLGYAKELDANSVCSSFVGTMQYLAPEFFTSPAYSSSVDYWSLGLVSHEAITGVRPFLPNASSPVQWIPSVEKKSSNDICVYEVPGSEKEIKYSQELFVENYISRCLREELEKWIRLGLEWNPKKRGRSSDNKLVIFSMLDEILSKKIVTVFCVSVLACHSYQVDSATAVSTLQLWIERDTRQPVSDQLLLFPSGKPLTNDSLAIECWNPDEITMLYVFCRSSFLLPHVKVAERLPSLVRWLMEHPKVTLAYHHQKHVWRHAVFFLRQEYELFQLLLEAYAVKMLSLLDQSYELSQLETSLSIEIEHLIAMHKMSTETLEFDNKCFSQNLLSIPSLASLTKLIGGWATEMNTGTQRIASYREAQSAMRDRVQEALRCTGSLQEYRDPGQHDLLTFDSLLKEGYQCYDNLRKRKDQTQRHQSLDMARIVYNCLKQIDISLRNQEFESHLKLIIRCETEIQTLNKSLTALKKQVVKSQQDVMSAQYQRHRQTWALVKQLATKRESDSRCQSTLSLTHPSSTSPSVSPLPQNGDSITIPPPPSNVSPVMQRVSQVPVYPSLSASPSPTLSPSTNSTVGFDLSAHQRPLAQTHKPATPIIAQHPSVPAIRMPKSSLDSDSLIQDNINIRYAMQDSIVSFTQCSNAIADRDFDWSYLETIKNK